MMFNEPLLRIAVFANPENVQLPHGQVARVVDAVEQRVADAMVRLSFLNTRSWVHERRSNAGQLAEGLSSIASTGYRLKGRPNSDTCWADLSPDFAPQRGETSYAAIRS